VLVYLASVESRFSLEPFNGDSVDTERILDVHPLDGMRSALHAAVRMHAPVDHVRAILALLAGEIPVHGLAHITGGGMLNLLRIGSGVGYEIDCPLPVPSVFKLIAELGVVAAAEMWEVFNMGCGFCATVPSDRAADAVALLGAHHPGTAQIGRLTNRAGTVAMPGLGVVGDSRGLRVG